MYSSREVCDVIVTPNYITVSFKNVLFSNSEFSEVMLVQVLSSNSDDDDDNNNDRDDSLCKKASNHHANLPLEMYSFAL